LKLDGVEKRDYVIGGKSAVRNLDFSIFINLKDEEFALWFLFCQSQRFKDFSHRQPPVLILKNLLAQSPSHEHKRTNPPSIAMVSNKAVSVVIWISFQLNSQMANILNGSSPKHIAKAIDAAITKDNVAIEVGFILSPVVFEYL
jgi:hypothetical protein